MTPEYVMALAHQAMIVALSLAVRSCWLRCASVS